MAADPGHPLRIAIRNALLADLTLQGLIGNPPRVYDAGGGVPEDVWPGDGATFPTYVTVGERDGTQNDTKTEDGMAGTITLNTWSSYRGFADGELVMSAVLDAVDRENLSLTGHTLILITIDFTDIFRDPAADNQIVQGIQRFRYLTQKD